MEILAPAGSPEIFLAAIEAGADAVYAGIGNFNARQRAKNFTLYDFKVLTDFAHRKKRKVYLTVNTVVKENELPDVYKLISGAYEAGADAFIVQDIGIYRMIKKFFPDAQIHASTQMAVHNAPGVKTLEKLGFSRVILARELTAAEINDISSNVSAELEIFVCGAMCFSFSGICYGSSILGGCSANRGLCTQPCRRKWNTSGGSGYFFSMCDLDASKYYTSIKNSVASIKIEGRMKNAGYVYNAVRYWRRLVSGEITENNEADLFTRKTSAYYISGMSGSVIDSQEIPAVGKKVGKIDKWTDSFAYVKTQTDVYKKDQLRLCNSLGDERKLLTADKIFTNGKECNKVKAGDILSFKVPEDFTGSEVYIAGREIPELLGISSRLKQIYSSFRASGRNKRKILPFAVQRPRGKNDDRRKPLLFVKLRDLSQIDKLSDLPYDRIILPFDSYENVFGFNKNLYMYKNKIVFELDYFLPQSRIFSLTSDIDKAFKQGFRAWIADGWGHIPLIPPKAQRYAGSKLYAFNTQANIALEDMGFYGVFAPYEDDFINIRHRASASQFNTIYTLFSYPLFFVSRAERPHFFQDGERFSDEKFKLICRKQQETVSFYSEKPFSVLQSRKKVKLLNPFGFLLDLSLIPEQGETYKKIAESYLKELPFENSFKYNFKNELK